MNSCEFSTKTRDKLEQYLKRTNEYWLFSADQFFTTLTMPILFQLNRRWTSFLYKIQLGIQFGIFCLKKKTIEPFSTWNFITSSASNARWRCFMSICNWANSFDWCCRFRSSFSNSITRACRWSRWRHSRSYLIYKNEIRYWLELNENLWSLLTFHWDSCCSMSFNFCSSSSIFVCLLCNTWTSSFVTRFCSSIFFFKVWWLSRVGKV